MVGSSFILVNKNGRRKLLNISRIVSLHNEDILLKGPYREIYWEYPPEQEMVYTIQIDLGGRQNFQYMFDKAKDRDELFDNLIAVISPSATIDSAPGLPVTWDELARRAPIAQDKPKTAPEDYTLEELRSLAMAQLEHLRAQAAQEQVEPKLPGLPVSKPPRKPRTPRP